MAIRTTMLCHSVCTNHTIKAYSRHQQVPENLMGSLQWTDLDWSDDVDSSPWAECLETQ